MLKLKPRKNIEDFMRLPEGTLAELIEGELFMTPAPTTDHQRIIGNLYVALRTHAASARLGEVLLSPVDVHLPSGDIVEPDLVFVATANSGIVREVVKGSPDLLIEVVSPSRPERDVVIKRALYARNGIAEYWIVNPETRTIEVLIQAAGNWNSHGYFESGDALTSPALPGLSLRLTDIFGSR